MTDTQIWRLEVARIVDTRKANAGRFAPLLKDSIALGMGGVLCVLAAVALGAMALTGFAWPGHPLSGIARGAVGVGAAAFLITGVQLWTRHARIIGEIMQIPGYTKAEFQRLAELNRKIKGQVK